MSIQSFKAHRLMKRWGQAPENIDAGRAAERLDAEIEAGLRGGSGKEAARENALPMIPSLVLPEGGLRAVPVSCLALDIGGTTVKCATVTVAENGDTTVSDLRTADTPGRFEALSEEEFFTRICRFAGITKSTEKLAVSFSHYMRALPGFDAELCGWCKEISVTEPSGLTLAQLFRRASGNPAMDVQITNDAVASMLGCVGEIRPVDSCLGLVIGTGFNICYTDGDGTVYNTEAGDSKAFPMGEIDRRIDAASSCPGEASCEKLVSGVYLSAIVSLSAETAAEWGIPLKESPYGKKISDYLISADPVIKTVAEIAVKRSAKIAACCTAAFLKRNAGADESKGSIVIGTEGSVINKIPKYKKWFLKELNACGVKAKRVKLTETDCAGLKGAARLMGM